MSEKLDKALTDIRKQYGKGAIFVLGEKDVQKVDAISTGILGLDNALGVGGLPRGRIVEIYGPEAGGKTTLALMIAAQTQKAGGKVGFIDAEHSLDTVYAGNLGVDIASVYISQPDNGEQALEIAEALIRSGDIDLVVVDSVAALVPKAELEGDMGDPQMGLQARLMSQALRKLTAAVHRSNCILLFINQIRSKIGIVFGNPETTSGGRALKFYSTVRLDIRRISSVKKKDEVIGQNVKIKIVKNKVAAPYKEIEVLLEYGKGFVEEK